MRQITRVAIGLGSNLGDRRQMIRTATERISSEFLEEVRVSSLYESEPWGISEQSKFLNAVVVGDSEWKPPAIVNFLKDLERDLGRVPGVVNGPRLIDMDLLAYGDSRWESEGVTVPHPRMTERDFVLAPFSEVWGEWLHPIHKKTINDIWRDFEKTKKVSVVQIVGTEHFPK